MDNFSEGEIRKACEVLLLLDFERQNLCFSEKVELLSTIDGCIRDKEISNKQQHSDDLDHLPDVEAGRVSLSQLHLHVIAKLLNQDLKLCLWVIYLRFGSEDPESAQALTESLVFMAVSEISEMLRKGILPTRTFIQMGGAQLMARIINSATNGFDSAHSLAMETLSNLFEDGNNALAVIFGNFIGELGNGVEEEDGIRLVVPE